MNQRHFAIIAVCAALATAVTAQETTTAATSAPTTAPTTAAEATPAIVDKQLPPNAAKRPMRKVFATILNAEISYVKPEIIAGNEFDTPKFNGDNAAWAEIVIQLAPGRSVSRFDFQLNIASTTCPCTAIAKGTAPYSMDKATWLIEAPQKVEKTPEPATEATAADTPVAEPPKAENESDSYVRMLFAIPKKNVMGFANFDTSQLAEGVLELTEPLKAVNTNFKSDNIFFRVMGDAPLSPVTRITPDGLCGKNLNEFNAAQAPKAEEKPAEQPKAEPAKAEAPKAEPAKVEPANAAAPAEPAKK